MKKISKGYLKALKEKMRLEAFACGKGTKDKYRIHFCKQANEWVAQLYAPRDPDGKWLCLH